MLPSETTRKGFAFGLELTKDALHAKELIGPDAYVGASPTPYETFFKPINRFEIGERVNRRYSPDSFNPNRKFGMQAQFTLPHEIKDILSNAHS